MWQDSSRTRIKLCEFESLDTAYSAAKLGADALGFHLFKHQNLTERITRFKEIFRNLPREINKVLLSDLDLPSLIDSSNFLGIDTIQLYPDWKSEEIITLKNQLYLPVKILKVISAIPDENAITDFGAFIKYYSTTVDGFLLDSFRSGGTGKTADWNLCREIVKASPLPVFLAGGLTSENVSEAIRRVQPFGVDVETGVSDRIPGGPLVKNMFKCAAFIDAVRHVDRKSDKGVVCA